MVYNPALAPLTREEIETVVSLVKSRSLIDDTGWFETITLDEPEPGPTNNDRNAYVCCYERSSNTTFQGLVSLSKNSVEEWRNVPGVQARIVPDEFTYAQEIAKADPDFQAACAKRGITDLSDLLVEAWAAGNFGVEEEEGERIAFGHCWLQNDAGDNPYGRPVANLHPVVDLRRGKLIRIDDYGVVPIPPDTKSISKQTTARQDLKELNIIQPDGPSFEVDGQEVRWQKWHVQVGFDLREGLVLHNIGYEDQGTLRPIMRRASMAEMVVPYGDPTGGNFRRNAFDTGEYGIGQATSPLTLGCDCLGHIYYFDLWSHDWNGEPVFVKNAVCMHEEDYGMLWKYTDPRRDQSSVTRSRRLVISSVATIGNYIYGFFWYFYQDGTIGTEVKATGVPLPSAIEQGRTPEYGTLVAPGIDSHIHQHVFSFRFDMAVDGTKNSLAEMNFEAVPWDDKNPHGNAILTKQTIFETEQEAQREMNLPSARYWKVINENKLNGLGQPTGYKLVPGTNALPFLHPDSPVGKRAGFMFKHLWCTPYEKNERFPAGWFPNQHAGGDGLPSWTEANRSIRNEDIVVWYTMNYHHLPRPEDWPVQPTVYAGFHWMPFGFFDENPAMDVPVSGGHAASVCCE